MKTGGSEWQVGVMTRKTKGRMGIVTWKVVQKKKFLFDGAEKENEEKILMTKFFDGEKWLEETRRLHVTMRGKGRVRSEGAQMIEGRTTST
jgi:hypothetical protein